MNDELTTEQLHALVKRVLDVGRVLAKAAPPKEKQNYQEAEHNLKDQPKQVKHDSLFPTEN